MKKSLIVSGLLVLVATSAFAFAETGKEGPAPHKDHPGAHGHFAKMDANKDGKVTREEARAMADQHFARLDLNKDGAITREEAKKAHEDRKGDDKGAPDKDGPEKDHGPRKHWKEADTDGDGRISQAEAEAQAKKMFQKFDKNHDGFLSTDELPRGPHHRDQ